jgi:hypothetical protein
LQYVLCGLFDSPALTVYGSLLDVEGLGIATRPDDITGPRFLVANAFRHITVEPVPQRRGGIKYAVDQGSNPGTIAILPGGVYQETSLLAGNIGTVADDDEAVSLFADFSRVVTKGFTKVRAYRVGAEALALARQGVRLTADARSSKEYDIVP